MMTSSDDVTPIKETLENEEYLLIATTPRSTLTWSCRI